MYVYYTLCIQHVVGTQLIYFINTSLKASGSRNRILHIFFVPLNRVSKNPTYSLAQKSNSVCIYGLNK